jgi:hypothetical protein
MSYELHVAGDPAGWFASEQEVLEAAALALRQHPDTQVEIIDRGTGRPALLGRYRDWRQQIRRQTHHPKPGAS